MSSRKPHPRAGLNRDEIVAEAIRIVESDGPAALTMRQLSARLGVNPNTVYWHVGNRESLLSAMVAQKAEEIAGVQLKGSTPRARVADGVHRARAAIAKSASVAILAFEIGAEHQLVRPLAVAIASEIEAAGVDGIDAGVATVSFLAVVSGFTTVEMRRPERAADGLAPDALSEGAWRGLTDFDHHDAAFDMAINAILDAVFPSG
ncbi:TetR/AcrR family transcriptional regulator [Candidatus Poriferisocius sp.]|uniref:TetR/AcrR family transcriptional regulator n=1 Tax=Candidatus Poriferisocius sp. TaxID=3101276 RepID=UPI003B0204EF